MMKFHQLYQVSRGTRFKPIATYLFLGEGIQQAERIVHAHRLIAEMIAVVVFLQQFTSFGIIYAQCIGKGMNVLVKILMKLRITDTTEFRITVVHRDVHQVIQITEHAYLAELRHARQHGKMNRTVARLEGTVKSFECVTEFCLQFRIRNGLKHGLVILIYQNHYTTSRLFIRPLDDIHETFLRHTVFLFVAIEFFPYFQVLIQNTKQRLIIIVIPGIQVHVKHRMHRPVLFQIFHGKPLEKFTLSQKISL